MHTLRRRAVALLLAAGLVTSSLSAAHAATRAYVMRGLLGWLFTPAAMDLIGADLRGRGMIVTVGSWTDADGFARDACQHKGDAVVIVGHSLGADQGAAMANAVHACGIRSVRLVAVDPPASAAAVGPGVRATTFVGALGGAVAGGRQIPAPGLGHIEIVTRLRARIVAVAAH